MTVSGPVIKKTLLLLRKNWTSEATLFKAMLSLEELVSLAPEYIHPAELDYANRPMASERKYSYLLGRFCAKQALKAQLNFPTMSDIFIQQGVFNQPVLSGPGTQDTQISIAHSGNLGVAIAYPTGHPMGIDIERINPKRESILKKILDPQELPILSTQGTDPLTLLTWIWTAKEALGKTLCTGLTVPFSLYEVQDVQIEKGLITATYKNFRQYKVVSYCWEEAVVSIALPRQTQLTL